MTRSTILASGLWLGLTLGPALAAIPVVAAPAETPAANAAAEAAEAADAIRDAIARLGEALGASDQVVALADVIRAYEEGQAALREGLRQAAAREGEIRAGFDARRESLGQILSVMATIEAAPETTLLLHPAGPEATARSGLVMAAVTPALQQEVSRIEADLDEIATIRRAQELSAQTLAEGLDRMQQARRLLASAVTDRSTLPTRFLEDPEEVQALVSSADNLDDFARGIAALDSDVGPPLSDFEGTEGGLPLPVMGTILHDYKEADRAGVSRPGIVVATAPRALVTTPWPATIRYRGPLLDYGNVMILEPAQNYLIVLAGMEQVFGETGDVLAAGAPVGLMGGNEGSPGEFGVNFVVDTTRDDPADRQQTLYIELRHGKDTLDPGEWFVANAVASPATPKGSVANAATTRAASANETVIQVPVAGGAATDGTDG